MSQMPLNGIYLNSHGVISFSKNLKSNLKHFRACCELLLNELLCSLEPPTFNP